KKANHQDTKTTKKHEAREKRYPKPHASGPSSFVSLSARRAFVVKNHFPLSPTRLALTFHNSPNPPALKPEPVELLLNALRVVVAHPSVSPTPMLKTRNISSLSTSPSFCSHGKTGAIGQL